MRKKDYLFITGMGRSGTTLLEKLLCNHGEISMLSQPFPYLFIEAKKRFLHEKGQERYYVLNDSLENSNYSMDEFFTFAEHETLTPAMIAKLFEKMKGFSGQMTEVSGGITDFKPTSGNLVKVYKDLVNRMRHKKSSMVLGSKEILCEEFLPLFMDHEIKTMIIVRDPRDVLASVNYPKSTKFLGEKKPALFVLRTWRKSVEYLKYLRVHEDFRFLKYEELVKNTYEELGNITDFLKIPRFDCNTFQKGIMDQAGKPWRSNSSHLDTNLISSKSIGSYKKILSEEEIMYTESICAPEMKYMGYEFDFSDIDRARVIRSFRDIGVQPNAELCADYSSLKEHVDYEINRGTE